MAIKTVKATINGQAHTLTYNSETGKYEATVTAPNTSSYNQTGHYYNVQIAATDDADNITTIDASDSVLGTKCQLVVKEKVAPVQLISYPTSGAYIVSATPTFEWSVTDDDSGVDEATISITIDGSKITEGIAKSATENGYTCTYTPAEALGDGEHTIAVDAKDHDGNASTQQTVTFKIDTVPPVLVINSPDDNYVTNIASLTVSGTTNDVTSSPCTVTVNNEPVTVNGDGSFSKVITLTEGTNIITVVSTDTAGKSTTVTRTVTLDTGSPEITDVSLTPNPVDAGATYIISVTVVDN